MNHQFHMQLVQENGQRKLQLLCFTSDYDVPPYFPNFTSTTHKKLLAEVPWEEDSVILQLEMRENDYTFRYGAAEDKLTELAKASGIVRFERLGKDKKQVSVYPEA